MLPYYGKQTNKLLSKMKKHLNKSLPTEINRTTLFITVSVDETCKEKYVGKTDRKIEERIIDQTNETKIHIC